MTVLGGVFIVKVRVALYLLRCGLDKGVFTNVKFHYLFIFGKLFVDFFYSFGYGGSYLLLSQLLAFEIFLNLVIVGINLGADKSFVINIVAENKAFLNYGRVVKVQLNLLGEDVFFRFW